MQIFCRKPSFTLFDRERLHSCVPSKFDTFRERSVGLGRPLSRPTSVLPSKQRLTEVRFPPVGMTASLFAIASLGLLSCSLVAIAGKATQKSVTVTSSSWTSLIAEASQRFGVPAHWIRAVMQLESTGDEGALSPKGAMG